MKAKVSRKGKSNVVYISSYKKRNVVKPYAKFDLDWQEILRANNSSKRLAEAAVMLSARVAYELHRNNDRPVFLTPDWFAKVTKKQRHQNGRLRHQIDHIFNFEFRPKVRVDGILLSNVYEVWYTVESQQILNLEDVKILQEAPTKPHKLGLVSCSKNASMVEQKCSMGGAEMLQPIVDKEKEEEALAYSSSFSNNEKLKIKNFTEPESAAQEPIIEVPTLAISSLAELAKVYQTEEIRSEARKVVNCDQLEEQPYEKIVQLKSRILVEETASISSEEGSVNTGRIDQITQLKTEIFKAFDSKTSEEIMENCTFTELEPNKLGISIRAKFIFSEHDKQKLKTCVHMTYGSEIKMVNTSATERQPAPIEEVSKVMQAQSNCLKWDRFKNELLKYFPEKTGDHILNAWFDKLRVSEDAPNNRIILTGSTFYVDSIYSRFETAIEGVVKKMAASQNKVTLELHYENNSQRPIIYKPNGGF